jgi:outer membrane murein-binding lipoprotein Lpp
MKKNFFICILLAIAGIMVTGCSSSQSENKKQDAVTGDVSDVNPAFWE